MTLPPISFPAMSDKKKADVKVLKGQEGSHFRRIPSVCTLTPSSSRGPHSRLHEGSQPSLWRRRCRCQPQGCRPQGHHPEDSPQSHRKGPSRPEDLWLHSLLLSRGSFLFGTPPGKTSFFVVDQAKTETLAASAISDLQAQHDAVDEANKTLAAQIRASITGASSIRSRSHPGQLTR
jgi:hypothetical protein